jgi:hypothetical protein
MYERTESFHFMHCWKMLHNEAKWNDKLLEVRSTPSVVKDVAAAACNLQHGNDNAPMERHEARDSAKNDGPGKTLHHLALRYKCCNKCMIEK